MVDPDVTIQNFFTTDQRTHDIAPWPTGAYSKRLRKPRPEVTESKESEEIKKAACILKQLKRHGEMETLHEKVQDQE